MRDANAAVLRAAGSSGHHDAATTIVAAVVRADEAIIAQPRRQPRLPDPRRDLPAADGGSLRRHGARDHPFRRRSRAASNPTSSSRAFARTIVCCSAATVSRVTSRPRRSLRRPAAARTCASRPARSSISRTRAAVRTTSPCSCMHPDDGRPSRATAGRAVAFAVFALLILVTVGGAIAVLFAVGSATPPSSSARPSAARRRRPYPRRRHPLPATRRRPRASPSPSASP